MANSEQREAVILSSRRGEEAVRRRKAVPSGH
jgi:hypothetical protein